MADADIRIRSYNVGFGDCFLLSFPDGDVTRNMLIDFGCAPGQSKVAFAPIVEDIFKETEGHLDVVVLTHDHIDHMSGFLSQKREFDKIKVDYVWMNSTCEPTFYDEESASTLRRARKLVRKFNKRQKQDHTKMARSFETLLSNNLNADEQLDYVRGLTKKREDHVLYLKRGDSVLNQPFSVRTQIEVLAPAEDIGPYYENYDFDEWNEIQDLDSISKRLSGKLKKRKKDQHPMFSSDEYYNASCVDSPTNLAHHDWRSLRKKNQSFGVQEVRALDCAVNNTSLVLLLTVEGRKLLFTGDAEAASWNRVKLCDDCIKLVEPTEDCSGCEQRNPNLESIDFLKLSHHGSKTGTPSWISSALKPDATVMVSTKTGVYGTKNPVPDPGVMAALLKQHPGLNVISTNDSDRLWVEATLSPLAAPAKHE